MDYYAKSVFTKKSVFPMYFSALLKSENMTAEMVTELEEMLEKRKRELQEKDD